MRELCSFSWKDSEKMCKEGSVGPATQAWLKEVQRDGWMEVGKDRCDVIRASVVGQPKGNVP